MKKSSEMPDFQVFKYDSFYYVTPLFVNDLRIVLTRGNVAYVDAKKFFDQIEGHNNVFPAAVLKEFLNKLSELPYRVVANFINIINNESNFSKYFEKLEKTKPESNAEEQEK